MEDKSAVDAFIAKCVEESTAPYRDLVPPEVLDAMREDMTIYLTSQPTLVRLTERLYPPILQQSGEIDNSSTDADAAPARYGKGGA